MGAFLDKPITDKETISGSGTGINFAVSDMQGWRAEMEDAHTAVGDIPGRPGYSFFAVFDGHGGKVTSKHAGANILEKVLSQPEFRRHKTPEDIGRALTNAFLEIDIEIKRLPQMTSGEDHSGSTAIACVITPTHIIMANSGDSRSVLLRGSQIVEPMSYDHKPDNEGERRRITSAGGSVMNGRVNGDLAVARALGDFQYKTRGDLRADEQMVSPRPDVKIVEREETDVLLLLACDGIWDVMSNEAAALYLLELARSGERSIGLMCEEIIDECLAKGSRDNMTALVVGFPALAGEIGEGDGVAGARARREAQEAAAAERDARDSPYRR